MINQNMIYRILFGFTIWCLCYSFTFLNVFNTFSSDLDSKGSQNELNNKVEVIK